MVSIKSFLSALSILSIPLFIISVILMGYFKLLGIEYQSIIFLGLFIIVWLLIDFILNLFIKSESSVLNFMCTFFSMFIADFFIPQVKISLIVIMFTSLILGILEYYLDKYDD